MILMTTITLLLLCSDVIFDASIRACRTHCCLVHTNNTYNRVTWRLILDIRSSYTQGQQQQQQQARAKSVPSEGKLLLYVLADAWLPHMLLTTPQALLPSPFSPLPPFPRVAVVDDRQTKRHHVYDIIMLDEVQQQHHT